MEIVSGLELSTRAVLCSILYDDSIYIFKSLGSEPEDSFRTFELFIYPHLSVSARVQSLPAFRLRREGLL